MSALDLTDTELAEMADPETAKVCGIYERQVAAMAAELQRRRADWKDAAIRMTALESRAADAVRAARSALTSGLEVEQDEELDLAVPGIVGAIATLAGAILLAGQAVRS